MMKNFEDLGKFWLPETNHTVVQGKLLRDLERHPGLEVYDELVGQNFEGKDSFVVLTGLTQNRKRVDRHPLVRPVFSKPT